MIYKEFVQSLSETLNISKAKTSSYTHKLINIILKSAEKEDVTITGFGKFVYHQGMRARFKPDDKLINEINLK